MLLSNLLLRSALSLGRQASMGGLTSASLFSQSHLPFARGDQRQSAPTRGRSDGSNRGRSASPPPRRERGHSPSTPTGFSQRKSNGHSENSFSSSKQRPSSPHRDSRKAHEGTARQSGAASPSHTSRDRSFSNQKPSRAASPPPSSRKDSKSFAKDGQSRAASPPPSNSKEKRPTSSFASSKPSSRTASPSSPRSEGKSKPPHEFPRQNSERGHSKERGSKPFAKESRAAGGSSKPFAKESKPAHSKQDQHRPFASRESRSSRLVEAGSKPGREASPPPRQQARAKSERSSYSGSNARSTSKSDAPRKWKEDGRSNDFKSKKPFSPRGPGGHSPAFKRPFPAKSKQTPSSHYSSLEWSSSPRSSASVEPPEILSAPPVKARKPRTIKTVPEVAPAPSRLVEQAVEEDDAALDSSATTDLEQTGEQQYGQLLFSDETGGDVQTKDGAKKQGRNEPMRLALRIARSGLCSRRQAEQYIEQGDVKVKREGSSEQEVVTDVVTLVGAKDVVYVKEEKLVREAAPRMWLHYKKQHVLVTHSDQDPRGRTTLFPHLRRMGLPHVISVGRLDYQSEGLLILTNNGRLARYFELPQNSFKRVYRVRIFGLLTDKKIQLLSKGLTIKGIRYKGIKVELDPEKNRSTTTSAADETEFKNQWLRLTLTEGKNREIRHMLAAVNIKTSRIIRIQYGPYRIQQLSPGDVREVPIFPAIKNALRNFETE